MNQYSIIPTPQQVKYIRRGFQPENIAKRFWLKVAITANDKKCWNWTASKLPFGYGNFQVYGKRKSAHKFSYELNKGEVPNGLCVLHSCDNPLCVNPKHLSLGTHAENSADMVRKNRQAKGLRSGRYTKPEKTVIGEKCFLAKLKEENVIDILSKSLSAKEYSVKYNITKDNIWKIWCGKTWKHLKRN